MVTAEVALALPALVVVTALLLGIVGVITTRASCADAARAAARSAARGDDDAAVLAAARSAHPAVDSVVVSRQRVGTVEVVVRARPGALSLRLPLPDVAATATAYDETVVG